MSNFDCRLSLDIDACHVILDGLRGQHGIAATVTRWWWQVAIELRLQVTG